MTKLISASLLLLSLNACIKREKMDSSVNPNAKIETGGNVIIVKETLKTGEFKGFDHSLKGKTSVVKDSTGNIILSLEDYTMTSGPDVDVFLSKSSAYSSSNVIKIAHLPNDYVNATVNIDIDDKTDLASYKYVLIWCTKFSVSFGYAELK